MLIVAIYGTQNGATAITITLKKIVSFNSTFQK